MDGLEMCDKELNELVRNPEIYVKLWVAAWYPFLRLTFYVTVPWKIALG